VQNERLSDENKQLISAVDYYFLEDDGGRFKVSKKNSFIESLSIIEIILINIGTSLVEVGVNR
jgi:hypothetical protein